MRGFLVIMAKAPVMGEVKTRLAAEIGSAEAVRFYRANLAATMRRLNNPRWRLVLAVSPDHAVDASIWPAGVPVIGQGRGNLGERMQRVFDILPPGPAIIIGSDIPGIRRDEIAAAFKALGDYDAVIGPAPDGGYWLIGLKRFPHIPRAFSGVRWSTDKAYADTVAALQAYSVAMAATREDVDDAAAFRRWRLAPDLAPA